MLLYLILTSFSFSFLYEKIQSWEFLRHEIKIINLTGHELEYRTIWSGASLLLQMKHDAEIKWVEEIAQNCL